MQSSREVHALVFDYLLKADPSLAKNYQAITKAEPLHKYGPSLEEVVLCYLSAHSNKQYPPGNAASVAKASKSPSVALLRLPEKATVRSPPPGPATGRDRQPTEEPPRCEIDKKRDPSVGETSARAVGAVGSRKLVKKESPRGSLSCRKASSWDWAAKLRKPEFFESGESSLSSDSDSGVDDASSLYSSVSSRSAPAPRIARDGLPTAPGDEWTRCDQCGRLWEDGDCLMHGPPITVPDSPVPADTPPSERAARSVPPILRVGPSGVHRGGLGVWTRRPLPAGIRFGPYRGRREKSLLRASAGGCSWEVMRNGKLWFCVDAADPAHANWMRYINSAPSHSEENVTAYQHQWRIWYRTCRDIPANQELLVYYGDEYAREMAREAAGWRKRRCRVDAPRTV